MRHCMWWRSRIAWTLRRSENPESRVAVVVAISGISGNLRKTLLPDFRHLVTTRITL